MTKHILKLLKDGKNREAFKEANKLAVREGIYNEWSNAVYAEGARKCLVMLEQKKAGGK